MTPLAARIRDARRAKQLRQTDLAAQLGCDQSCVSRWERGHDEPSESYAAKLAAILDIEVGV